MTGVQTCALPICSAMCDQGNQVMIEFSISRIEIDEEDEFTAIIRSEERRVGKECRSRGSPDH